MKVARKPLASLKFDMKAKLDKKLVVTHIWEVSSSVF